MGSLTQDSNGSRLEHQAFLSISGLHNHTVWRWIQFMINTITFTECHDSTQPVSALHKIKKYNLIWKHTIWRKCHRGYHIQTLNRPQVQISMCIKCRIMQSLKHNSKGNINASCHNFCKDIISLLKYTFKIAIKSCMVSVLYEMKDNKML